MTSVLPEAAKAILCESFVNFSVSNRPQRSSPAARRRDSSAFRAASAAALFAEMGIYLYLVFFNMFHFLYESLPNGIHIFVSDTSVGRHAAFPGSGSLPSLSDTEAAEYLVEKLFAGVKPEQRRQLPSGLGKTGKDQVVTQIGEECLASGLDGLLRP